MFCSLYNVASLFFLTVHFFKKEGLNTDFRLVVSADVIHVGMISLKLTAKLAICRTYIIPVLLYGSETWTLLKSDLNRLELFHMRCKHSILGIQWFYFVNNYEVTQRTCLPPINHLFQRRHTAFFGHVARLADNIPA